MPSSPAALIGTAVHAGAAAYDEARRSGAPIPMDEAALIARDAVEHPEQEVDWRNDEYTKTEALMVAGWTTGLYVTRVADTMTYVSVEEQLPDVTIRVGEVDITLTGHVDRIRIDDTGAVGVSDLKTGRRIHPAVHRPQLAVYRTMATVARPELAITGNDEIIAMDINNGTVERVALPGDSMAMLVGSEGRPGLLHHVASMMKNETFYGNPRSQLCSAKFCPRYKACPFK